MVQSFVEARSQYFWWSVGFLMIPVLGALDHWSGYEHSIALVYLLPIGLLAWFSGWAVGAVGAGTSALMWLAADISSGHPYVSGLTYFWNAGMYLGIFLVVAYFISRLAESSIAQAALSERDALTGVMNGQAFYEAVEAELYRMERYTRSFTVAYLDLDDLNEINAKYGHSAGDKVLCEIVNGVESQIRQSDVVGRIGGDEFAVLLPETGAMEAQVVFTRIQNKLQEIMEQKGSVVTFSLGVVTCTDTSCEPKKLIKMANALMYEGKRESKNGINYGVYSKATASIMDSGC